MQKEQAMRVLVFGGRDYGDLASLKGDRSHPLWTQRQTEYQHIMNELDRVAAADWPLSRVTIISGKATGVDSVAIDWAVANGCSWEEYPADWKTHGRSAGPIRNAEMIAKAKPDRAVAFPGGAGTADMERRCRAAGIPITFVAPF